MKKSRAIIVSVALFSTPAVAQQETYNLQVTASDLVVMSKLLAKGTFEEVSPLLGKLRGQIQAQASKLQEQLTPTPKMTGAREAGRPAPIIKEEPKPAPPTASAVPQTTPTTALPISK